MTLKKLPWLDYSGRLSPLKLVVFLALFAPMLWIIVGLQQRSGDFAARPQMEAIHQLGLWAIRLLMITLFITPARQLLQWPRLLLVRRMLGVAAFAYALTHLFFYIADQAFDFSKIVSEILLRIYLTIGFVALLGLTTLAVTSTDGMTRRLGGKRWQQLHRIVYGIGVLAVIHYFLQSKLDVWEPMIVIGFFVWMMGYRLIARARRGNRPPPAWAIGLLGIAVGVGTGLGEAAYFWLAKGIDPLLILPANFSLETGTRPSWIVLAAALAVTIAALARPLLTRRPKPRVPFAPQTGDAR